MRTATQQALIGLAVGRGPFVAQVALHVLPLAGGIAGPLHRQIAHGLRLAHVKAAVSKGLLVLLYRHAVEGDGALDALRLEGHRADLIGHTKHEQIGRHVVAEQALGQRTRIGVHIAVRTAVHVDGALDGGVAGKQHGVVTNHLAGRAGGGVDHGHRAAGVGAVEIHRIDAAQGVEHQVEIRGAQAHLVRGDCVFLREDDIGQHGAALLGEAGLVQIEQRLAFHERRIAQQGVDGNDAGAADPGNVDRVPLTDDRLVRRFRQRIRFDHRRLLGPQAAAGFDLYGHEGRAVAVQTGVILVARRLVNSRLEPQLGLYRMQ